MSGGNWDYFDRRFGYELEDFCNEIKERLPVLSKELLRKGKIIQARRDKKSGVIRRILIRGLRGKEREGEGVARAEVVSVMGRHSSQNHRFPVFQSDVRFNGVDP